MTVKDRASHTDLSGPAGFRLRFIDRRLRSARRSSSSAGNSSRTEVGRGVIKTRFGIIFVLILLVALSGYYYLVYRPQHPPVLETDYVISPSLDVLDTYAPVHTVLDVLKAGDPAQVLRRTTDWAEIRLPDGRRGWVLESQLIGPQTHAAGKALLAQVADEQVQAVGHTSGTVNLHIEPSRQAPLYSVLPSLAKLEMYDRRLVERSEGGVIPDHSPSASRAREAWYLVRTDSSPPTAGWVLGRLITLDIPPAISQYAEAYNLVAWRPLTFIEDGGQRIPEYVVADRVGSDEVDFNHIRVFTWSVTHHHYATAFVESGLHGEFPLTVGQTGGTPYFALRLTDDRGEKFEKFYGLFNTLVRPMGVVMGWARHAVPPPDESRGRGRHLRRKR